MTKICVNIELCCTCFGQLPYTSVDLRGQCFINNMLQIILKLRQMKIKQDTSTVYSCS